MSKVISVLLLGMVLYFVGCKQKTEQELATDTYFKRIESYGQLLKKADAGSSAAQYEVAKLLSDDMGRTLPPNPQLPVKYYTLAAEQGHTKAQVALGAIYLTGVVGQSPDHIKGAFWTEKAAVSGNPDAQYNLGQIYLNGLGRQKDTEKAFYWHSLSAEKGNQDASIQIALAYLQGQGISKDSTMGVKMLKDLAVKGNARAQSSLGIAYANGDGVVKDGVVAYAWFNLAAGQQMESARENRERMERTLSTDEVAEAQKISSRWQMGKLLSR
jgi:TPR repeat protein